MHASTHCQFWGVSTHGCLLGAIQLQQMKLKGFVIHLHGTNIQWNLSNTDTLGTKIIVLIKLRHPYLSVLITEGFGSTGDALHLHWTKLKGVMIARFFLQERRAGIFAQ